MGEDSFGFVHETLDWQSAVVVSQQGTVNFSFFPFVDEFVHQVDSDNMLSLFDLIDSLVDEEL